MKFKTLAGYFEKLENTAKRLEMTAILAEMFSACRDKQDIDKVIYLCQGQLLPAFKNIEFGISEKLILRALAEAVQTSEEKTEKLFEEIGDLGQVAENLCKQPRKNLDIDQVYAQLQALTEFSGTGSVNKKISFLADFLRDVGSQEAKYLIRIIIGKLRLGIGDPTVLDALSCAYSGAAKLRPVLERAYNLCSDLGLVARILFKDGIKAIENFKVIVGCPIRVALAARLPTAEEIIEKIGPCAVEGKYDGFRCQVHKSGDKIQIFSRNLENTTAMFPDICQGTLDQIKEENVIFEGEALTFDPGTGECLPFQVTVQRKRKHDIDQMQKKFPLKIFVFDLLYAKDDLTKTPYSERREIMSKIIKNGDVLEISPVTVVHTAKELSAVFEESVTAGLEGIVAKRLDSGYQAGGRNFNWIKLKRSYSGELNDTIDCVVLGYFFGKGARASFGIGSLLVGVYDQKEERFKTIAKLGSGLSEDDLEKWKEMLDKIKLKNKDRDIDALIQPDVWVEPRYVVEVKADEITRSPVHTCGKKDAEDYGYALRFPRILNFVRQDKNPQDATSVDEIKKMFSHQGRKK